MIAKEKPRDKAGKKKTPDREADRYHDTRRLLQKYRRVAYTVKENEEDLGERMEVEYGIALQAFRESAEALNIDLSGTRSESHARSVYRSKCMLTVIDHALEVVKRDPDHGELMYWILYYAYFAPTKLTRDGIMEKLDEEGYRMSATTYHKYQQLAIEAMDGVLWGYTAADCMKIVDEFFPET